jgi:hypothetical protein
MPVKGKVERPFRYVREDFFLARSFRHLEDLNAQFTQWLDRVANRRLHGTTGRIVAEHFAEERPSLRPPPAGPFNAVLRPERRISHEGMGPSSPAWRCAGVTVWMPLWRCSWLYQRTNRAAHCRASSRVANPEFSAPPTFLPHS